MYDATEKSAGASAYAALWISPNSYGGDAEVTNQMIRLDKWDSSSHRREMPAIPICAEFPLSAARKPRQENATFLLVNGHP